MNDLSRLWKMAFLSTYESLFEVGRIGRHEADDTVTIIVPGRTQRVYVELGAGNVTGVVEAVNLHAPRLAGTPVKLLKLARTWVIWGVDESSPAFSEAHYNVAYHTHAPGSGLDYTGPGSENTFLGLDDVVTDELVDGEHFAYDAATGTIVNVPAPVSSVNGQTGAVSLDSDDIAEGTVNLYISDVELIKLAGIESGADVTDQANVAAAIDGATENTALSSTDRFAQTVSGVLRWVSFGTLRDTITSYYNSVVATLTNKSIDASANTLTNVNTSALANDAASNAKLADMAEGTIKGRVTASTGDPEDLSPANVRTLINVADGADVTGPAIATASTKATLHGSDRLGISDFEASGALKAVEYDALLENIDLDLAGGYVSANFDKSADTTLETVTGLSLQVVSGRRYTFHAVVFIAADLAGGHKIRIGGTATYGTLWYQVTEIDNDTDTIINALTVSSGQASNVGAEDVYCVMEGFIHVTGNGTLTVEFAQQVATGNSGVLTGSTLTAQRVA